MNVDMNTGSKFYYAYMANASGTAQSAGTGSANSRNTKSGGTEGAAQTESFAANYQNKYAESVAADYGQEKVENAAADYGQEKAGNAATVSRRKYEESAVTDYKRRHPESASNVDAMVKAGKKVLGQNGADRISRDEMTMEEYKQFITGLMNSIPFDVSQRNCTEIWSITEAGWEQMKNDPDYEAWVLGYTVLNRSVHFPAMLDGVSNLCTEKFGASIDEHLGQSVPTGNQSEKKSASEDDEETWWQRRHRRIEEILAAQAEAAIAENQAKRLAAIEMYEQEACESRQRMQDILI